MTDECCQNDSFRNLFSCFWQIRIFSTFRIFLTHLADCDLSLMSPGTCSILLSFGRKFFRSHQCNCQFFRKFQTRNWQKHASICHCCQTVSLITSKASDPLFSRWCLAVVTLTVEMWIVQALLMFLSILHFWQVYDIARSYQGYRPMQLHICHLA